MPFVQPEEGSLPIPDFISRPKLKEVFDLVDATPELRASLARFRKDVVNRGVFRSQDLGPEGIVILEKFPNPLEH
jgi:hypothetical protein